MENSRLLKQALGFLLLEHYFGTLAHGYTIPVVNVFICEKKHHKTQNIVQFLCTIPRETIKEIYSFHFVSLDKQRMPDLRNKLSEQGHLLQYAGVNIFKGKMQIK